VEIHGPQRAATPAPTSPQARRLQQISAQNTNRGPATGGADRQPLTIVVDEMGALALGGPFSLHAWHSATWPIGIVFVFVPLAVRSYRRAH
jgi:hypothetical protein